MSNTLLSEKKTKIQIVRQIDIWLNNAICQKIVKIKFQKLGTIKTVRFCFLIANKIVIKAYIINTKFMSYLIIKASFVTVKIFIFAYTAVKISRFCFLTVKIVNILFCNCQNWQCLIKYYRKKITSLITVKIVSILLCNCQNFQNLYLN